MSREKLSFDRARFQTVIDAIEGMAVGDLEQPIFLSAERDELDALSHGVNVLSGELKLRLRELQSAQSSLIQAGKLAALGEVSSGLAHELNNPLQIVAGYVEIIRTRLQAEPAGPGSTANSEELIVFIQKVERNLDRMNVIIRHIMEFARESSPVKEPLHVGEILEKSMILMNEQLRLKKVHVEMDLDPKLMAEANAAKLEQVFINLLTNARDAITEAHGDTGGRIKVHARALSNTEVEIEVSDNGVGIGAETQSKIFNPFFTTKAVGKGTGLGLSISHGIVRDHGGSIACVSEIGKGAVFIVRLPRYIPRESAAT